MSAVFMIIANHCKIILIIINYSLFKQNMNVIILYSYPISSNKCIDF